MSTLFEPKIDLPAGAIAPDIYDDAQGMIPLDSFVVSRHRDGSIASTFGQLSWNFTACHPDGRTTWMHFDYWKEGPLTPVRDKLARETRWFLFALIWLRDGASLSVGTLQYYTRIILELSRFSESISVSLQQLLSDEARLLTFSDDNLGAPTKALSGFLSNLVKIGETRLGFDIVGDKLLRVLQVRGLEYSKNLKQHAPIPTRIYSTILSRLGQELTDWEFLAPEVLSLLQKCVKDSSYGRGLGVQRKVARQRNCAWVQGPEWEPGPEWEDVASPEIRAYLREKGQGDSVLGLSRMVNEVQLVSKLLIQAFSGMRDTEALSLPYDCHETTVSAGRTHRLILGHTTKLVKGQIKRTRWVTNQEGHRAIKLAQQIAQAIYACFDVTPKKTKDKTNDHPLFVSVGHLGLAGLSVKSRDGLFSTGTQELADFDRLRTRLQPTIEDADIQELEEIDLHRAWRSEKNFNVGSPWILLTHQFRRSLALYAQRSGLVSLPSLRRQLQHISEEMSRYYASGSEYAKNFMGNDKRHFGFEWQAAQAESKGLSYFRNVVFTDDQLFGGHAAWVAQRQRGLDGTVLMDRANTMRQFKEGLLSYRETPVGGCTKIGECDQAALNYLNVDCISGNCRNLVVSLKKLEKIITNQATLVKALNPESIEYRSENSDLSALVAARDKMLLAPRTEQ